MSPTNISASVRQRLLNRARESGEDFQVLLTRYALERFLYRLSHSSLRERFVLKGAFLFILWEEELHRMTRDLDLLGYGPPEPDDLAEAIARICRTDVPEDGVVFEEESISAQPIRDQAEYDGMRITMIAYIGSARLPLQIDVGFGDAVTPPPDQVDFPVLLDFPRPTLRAYPKETVVAEKLHGIVFLGIANSRMKDYYDLWFLSQQFSFEGEILQQAIGATFDRRDTLLPQDVPLGLSEEFANQPQKARQWNGFLQTIGRSEKPIDFSNVLRQLQDFLLPLMQAGREDIHFLKRWQAGGPWEPE